MPLLRRLLMLLALLAFGQAAHAAERGPVVLAASSLQEALSEAADAWAARGHPRPLLSFAASSSLARQAMAGAPADLFVSADEAWMDALARARRLRGGTRATLAANRLVLVAPAGSKVEVAIQRRFALASALGKGRLAIADTAAVPAGRYAKAALVHYGVWDSVASKLAPAENVRAALALVERGATPLGIVYATDARASRRVRQVALFPASSHRPIRYPVAILKASRHRDAAAFRAFLLSLHGRAIFTRHGFAAP